MKLVTLEPSEAGQMQAKYQREVVELVQEINTAWRATGRTGSPVRELLIALAQMIAWAEDAP